MSGDALPGDLAPTDIAGARGRQGRRAFWTFSDQALSSLTNAALAIVVARSVGEHAFGAFALALLTFSFVIGFGRATIADPYLIRFSDADDDARHEANKHATGAAIVLGLAVAAVCVLAALLIPEQESRGGLLALAISLPGLLCQDTWRYTFFASDRPAVATLNDAVWAVLQFAVLGVLLVRDVDSVFWITLVWGLSATAAAVLGAFQARAVPSPAGALSWFRLTRDLNVRMGIDFALNMGAVNLATYVVAGIVGLVATGSLRAAQTLLGPLFLFRGGLDTFAVPTMSRMAGAGRRVTSVAAVTSGIAAVVAAVWVAILFFLPTSVGKEILGASWVGAHSVMFGSGMVTIAVSFALGASLGLKALRRADLLLKVTLIQAPLILVLGCAGAWLWGAPGAANGFGLAQTIGAVISWIYFAGADRADRDWIERPEPALA